MNRDIKVFDPGDIPYARRLKGRWIKNLAKPCGPPSGYGIDCLKRLNKGWRPTQVSFWPCGELSRRTQQRLVEAPFSDFERQVLEENPAFSGQDAKFVAKTRLRCTEYAAQVGPLSVVPRQW